jgi:hypothetical protein
VSRNIEQQSVEDIKLLPMESDNHADTHYAGRNCRIEYYTNQSCSVAPFLGEYDALDDVPICSALTAVTLDTVKQLSCAWDNLWTSIPVWIRL